MSLIFNLEYYYGLLLNLVSDATLGLFLEASSKTCKIHTVWRKILTVENFDESGLGKF